MATNPFPLFGSTRERVWPSDVRCFVGCRVGVVVVNESHLTTASFFFSCVCEFYQI